MITKMRHNLTFGYYNLQIKSIKITYSTGRSRFPKYLFLDCDVFLNSISEQSQITAKLPFFQISTSNLLQNILKIFFRFSSDLNLIWFSKFPHLHSISLHFWTLKKRTNGITASKFINKPYYFNI